MNPYIKRLLMQKQRMQQNQIGVMPCSDAGSALKRAGVSKALRSAAARRLSYCRKGINKPKKYIEGIGRVSRRDGRPTYGYDGNINLF